jgi:superfamily II DNA or RNA helicase
MRDRFGLDFKIIDSEFMNTLRRTKGVHANPWQSFPRLITSIDYLKRDRPLRLFRECLPSENESPYPRRFELLILDEAHNAAPSGTGNYALDSQRTDVIRQITPHFEHKLFLSATPHNGYTESFTALLELLDPQRFARGVQPDKKQLASIMVRRLKSSITNWDGSPRFPERVLDYFRVDYAPEEREAHQKLREYTGA